MKSRTRIGLGAAGALALALGPSVSAFADVQAQSNDIVGVGSDTVQYLGDFIADGDTHAHAGYNATHLTARLVNLQATGDGFGSLSTGFGVVEKAQNKPVVRPDGSGTGYDAINADTNNSIQYVRASSTPNSARVSAANTAFGGYHAYRVATDDIRMAVSNLVVTNVPSGLTGAQLVNLYQQNPTVPGDLSTCATWASLGYGTSTDIAQPLIPQSGSGTRNSFLADLQNTYNGGTAITLGACVATVQEHDPKPIRSNPDAVGPFSLGRLKLIQDGYFSNAGISATDVALQTGTFPAARPLYIVLRQSDVLAGKPVVSALFGGLTGAYTRPAATNLYTSAGLVKSYQDCATVNNFC